MITLLAHGSPDPRHARDVAELAARVRDTGHAATVAYLEHDEPSPQEAASGIVGAGLSATTMVPLLLGPAYHARVDVPRAAGVMRDAEPGLDVAVAPPVGLHPLVVGSVGELVAAGVEQVPARTGIIVAGTGSRDTRATSLTAEFILDHAAALRRALGLDGVAVGFLDGGPSLEEAHSRLVASGCQGVLLATAVIAEGVLRDRIVAAAEDLGIRVVPGSLAQTHSMAALVVARAEQGA